MPDFELPDDFMDIQEESIQPAGMYLLRIVSAEVKENKSKNGETMILCRLDFADNPDAKTIFHRLIIPNSESKPGTKRMTKRFIMAFNLDPAQISTDAMLGLEAQIDVGLQMSDQYGNKNVLNLPKFE